MVMSKPPENRRPVQFDYHVRARAYGRRYAQLQQLMLHFQMNPTQRVTVMAGTKNARKEFVKFAKEHHVKIKTTRVKMLGNAYYYTIKSLEVKL